MANEKEIKGLEVSILEDEKVSGVDSEQVLLALLRTRIGERSIRDYVYKGDYPEIEISIKSILDELPESDGKAEVYIGDKKVILNENVFEVKNE